MDSRITLFEKSMTILMLDGQPTFSLDDVRTSSLSQKVKDAINEYCIDERKFSSLQITYYECFSYVWQRIMRSPSKEDLLGVLESNIMDNIEYSCLSNLSSRFFRTVQTLCGFEPDIIIC